MTVVLIQFLLRLAVGLAFALLFISPQRVACGFFRVHMWILLGLYTFSSLATYSAREPGDDPLVLTSLIAASVASYVGAVAWLYERRRLGLRVAALLMVLGFCAACQTVPASRAISLAWLFDIISAAALLGGTVTAMLLGHWYLNAPGMQLAPLQRLIQISLAAVALRAVVVGWGLWSVYRGAGIPDLQDQVILGLRWVAGLGGVAVTAWLAWQTLKIPNTQSATGILYVSVILAFLGELTSQLLSAGAPVPL